MPPKRIPASGEEELLIKILTVLQDLLIVQAAAAGVGKAEIRRIAGVADARVSRISRHIRKNAKELQSE